MKRFVVVSLFPELVEGFSSLALIHRAQKERLISVEALQLRDFAEPPHYRVDEKPYGGGPGMLMTCEPIVRALESLGPSNSKQRRILLSAKGRPFQQEDAKRLSEFDELVFVAGRYEGVDERVSQHFIDEEFSFGEAVLMGGELPALSLIEAISRFVPGVLGNEDSLLEESHSSGLPQEYAQYTRPREFRGHCVPEVLVSGDHSKVEEWRHGN